MRLLVCWSEYCFPKYATQHHIHYLLPQLQADSALTMTGQVTYKHYDQGQVGNKFRLKAKMHCNDTRDQ